MQKEMGEEKRRSDGGLGFWAWAMGSVVVRVALIYSPLSLTLSSRPEVSTPLTSLRRLAEGYWLKQSSMSPYAGSMYHGSPLLLWLLGPLVVQRIEGQPVNLLCSLLFVIADLISAMLIRKSGQYLEKAYRRSLKELKIELQSKNVLPSGDIAALAYLWNPFTIVACVGSSTSPVENLSVILALYGACTGVVPLAAFGWVIATHLSLYPAILIIPVIILLGRGLDAPPKKLFVLPKNEKISISEPAETAHDDANFIQSTPQYFVPWGVVILFSLWASVWSACLLALCSMCLKEYSHLWEMLQRTYGFILAVEDLSPNIGVLWYFYAEVFEFFRNFFLIVFHVNILFMVLPLAIRLNHRPFFLAFVYIAVSSMLKSYPSIGDSALYLGLLGLFRDQLAEMQFSFFLCCGYVGLSLLSPVMHNLWIWRGTGNANFYFGTALGYSLLQIILVSQCVSTMLNHDRKLKKLVQVGRPGSSKS